jgi:hypothetical protein
MTCAVAFAEWDTPLLAGRHQTGGAPEEGIVAGGDHHRRHLALLGDAPGVPLVAELDTQHVTRNSLLGVDGAEFPVAHRGGLDHVGDGPREKAQELLQLVDLFLYPLVAAVLLEPLLRLARREALGGRRERCLDGVETRLLQVVCASRLSIGCGFLVCFVHAVSSVIPLDTQDTAGFALIGVATISGPGCCWLESTRSRSGGVRSPVR